MERYRMVSGVLSVRDLTTGYHDPRNPPVVLARDLTAELSSAELVCLLGPNGAGKSTLLNTLSGALAPLSGRVFLGDDDVHRLSASARSRRIGVVLTDRVATGLLTSYQVVCLGRHPYTDWLGRLSSRDHEIAVWALEATGASHLKNRFLGELSDGERQRVLVARALAQEPEVLLLDEVTAFVDLPHRVQLMRLLREVARSSGTAVLLSTHDLDLALRTADRLWVLTRDAGLVEGGPEDLVLSGAIEAAFRGDEVEFDRAAGSFRMHAGSGPAVAVLGQGLHIGLLGAALGATVSLALARTVESHLHGVSARDPITIVLLAMMAVLVALAASFLPARRAVHSDPAGVIRGE
jgi:iron complex transport system ATP-binding protein